MKRFICFMIAISMVANFGLAAEVEETNESVRMSIEEAIDYAIKNNATIVDLEKTVKDQKDLYDDAMKEYYNKKNELRRGYYSFEDENEYLTSFGHLFEISKLQYESFLSNRESTKLQVKYSVKSMIYNICNIKDTIDFLEKSIEKQENDLEIAEVKYNLNMITENELTNAKSALETSKLSLKNAKDNLKSLEISLKKVMGFDVNEEIVFDVPEISMVELEVEDILKTIDDSMTTNNSVILAKIQYKQKENNYILATKTSFFTNDEKKDAKEDYKDAEFRLNNEISSIKENLTILYNQVKEKENEVKIAKNDFESAKIQFEQAKVMYDVGLISKNSYLGYEVAYMNSENTYSSKIKEEDLLRDRFNIAISVGDIIAK